MIEVRYNGRLGNQLFQYCMGRILAEGLGYELNAKPIEGFPNTQKPVKGKNYSYYFRRHMYGHDVDLKSILADKSKRNIVLTGYFQNYSYYKPHKTVIKRHWLKTNNPFKRTNKNDIVVHVRRTDCMHVGFGLPFSYYEDALETASYRRVFICTDDPQSRFLQNFKKYRPIIRHSTALNDFHFIMSFNKIIQSQSSYSWWASFLSKAKEIYTPVPLSGYWSRENGEKLKIDEERYVYINCREKYRISLKDEIKSLRYTLPIPENVKKYLRPVVKPVLERTRFIRKYL
jgi:hypothetical protein